MTDRKDHGGPFGPHVRHDDLSKGLVRLVREFALIVHLLDRSMLRRCRPALRAETTS
jgi:hypothetical protein